MMSNNILVIFSLFLLIFLSPDIENPVSQDKEEKKTALELIKEGNQFSQNGKYKEALIKYSEAEILAKKENNVEYLTVIYNGIGLSYKELSNYGEAMGYYQNAWKLAKEELKDKAKEATILNNIGLLYDKEGEKDKAIEYYLKAYHIAIEIDSDYNKVLLGINLAGSYMDLDVKKAQEYLKAIENVKKDAYQQQIWTVNYAGTLLK